MGKKLGKFTGTIYDDNDNPQECCTCISDEQANDDNWQTMKHALDTLDCDGCLGCPESRKAIQSKIISREFNDIGEKVTIQLKYEDLEISKLPESCMECPVGFMSHNCGRKVPLTEERPDSCKLKVIQILPDNWRK